MNYKIVDSFIEKNIIVIPMRENIQYNGIVSEIIDDIGVKKIFKENTEKCDFYSYYPKMDSYLAFIFLEDEKDITYEDIKSKYGNFIRNVFPDYYKEITVVIPEIENLDFINTAQAIYEGIKLGSYSFDKTKYSNKDSLRSLNIYIQDQTIVDELSNAIDRTRVICDGIIMGRDLVNKPGNLLNPESFADFISEQVKNTEITIEIIDEIEMQKRNIIGVYSVGKGSVIPPKLVILKYFKSSKAPTIALVGKGVTTDLGGVNLKIGPNLSAARTDMGGAAAVLGAIKIIESLEVEANVIAIIPMVENIYGSKALKPGEVIRYNNDVSVEIRNTDAEGRLILADGILLAKELKADIIIDVATLTGSCASALGSKYAGAMGTNDIVKAIMEAGEENGEMYWQLPLPEVYKKNLESDIADIGNISDGEPGVITAALFLKEFAGDSNWAHLDIAGTRNSASTYGYTIKGGTGFGVRTLLTYIEKISKYI